MKPRLLALPYHPKYVFTTELQSLNIETLRAWYLVLHGTTSPTGLKRAKCIESLAKTIKKLEKSFSSPFDQITSNHIKKLKKPQLRNWSTVFGSKLATPESILQSISEWGIQLKDGPDPEIPVAVVLNDDLDRPEPSGKTTAVPTTSECIESDVNDPSEASPTAGKKNQMGNPPQGV